MTNAEIETTYRELHIVVSIAQERYLENKTPENWEAYLQADKEFSPWRVKMGQMMMREQWNNSDPETIAFYTE